MKCLLLLIASTLVSALPIPPPHPQASAARSADSFLPPHQRSPALHNPRLREILALTSLLHHGEHLVTTRVTDSIPREEIYKILSHAGFVPRRPNFGHQQVDPFLYEPSSSPYHTHTRFSERLQFL